MKFKDSFRTDKEYLMIPLKEFKIFYGYEGPYGDDIVPFPTEETKLSDGTEVIMLLEYYPPLTSKGHMYVNTCGYCKDIIAKRELSGYKGFKTIPGCVANPELAIAYYNQEKTDIITYDFKSKKVKLDDIKEYIKKLKDKKLYKEYLLKVNNAYYISTNMREINNATRDDKKDL